MMLILRNDHFLLPNGNRYTLLADSPAQDIAYIYELHNDNALPEQISLARLHRDATKVDTTDIQIQRMAASQYASPACIELRDRVWHLIKPLVDNPSILDKGARWQLLTERAKEMQTSQNRLLRHLRRYWGGGQTRDALLGHYKNSGKVDLTKENARGRIATKPGSANYPLTQKDRDHFDNVINTYYLKDERKTLTDTLQRLYELYYTYLDGEGKRIIKPKSERPSRRQLQYHVSEHYSVEHRIKARKGRKTYAKDHRPVFGTIMQPCLGVGHIYEIDATIVDVTLVSSINRADIIGRPTLYYIIDRFSRLIVGWYLGLENPCWQAALHAIFSIAEDKRQLCERVGIRYDAEDWPAHGILPRELYADRGESVSHEATLLSSGLGTTVTNLPSCRPDWKPAVEGQFSMTHRAIADVVPGYNPASNARKRQAVDYSLEAALTLKELEAIFVKHIITHNRRVMEGYPMTKGQLADKVVPTPIEIWNHDIQTRMGQLSSYSADALRLALLPNTLAYVDERGIEVNGCFYKPVTEDKTDLFIAGRSHRIQVTVSYDRRRVDTIYVHDKRHPKGYYVAELTARSEKYAQMSVSEVESAKKLEQQLKSTASDTRAQQRLELHEFAKPIVERAQKQTSEAKKGVSKTARRKNIKETRELERDLERDTVAVLTSNAVAESGYRPHNDLQATAAPKSTAASNNVVSIRTKELVAAPEQAAADAVLNDTVPNDRPLTSKEIAQRARLRMFSG